MATGDPSLYQETMLRQVEEAGVEIQLQEFDTCHSDFVPRDNETVIVTL